MSKFVRFVGIEETTPSGLDGHRYRITFQLGEKRGEVFHPLEEHALDVEASRTLQAVWNKSDKEMAVSSGTTATSHILTLANEGRLSEFQTAYKLNTYTAPREPPTAPSVEPGALFPVISAPAGEEARKITFLSEDISEIRDQINALSKDLWGERLLLLSQERPLLDMYKSVQGAADFRARVQSLGIIAKDLNRDLLAKVAKTIEANETGDFVLLQTALQTLASLAEAEGICTVLKHVNNLRQGYPTHGDNAKKFLDSHRYFNLPYPVTDFDAAWESVLGAYFRCMGAMRDALSRAWRRKGS